MVHTRNLSEGALNPIGSRPSAQMAGRPRASNHRSINVTVITERVDRYGDTILLSSLVAIGMLIVTLVMAEFLTDGEPQSRTSAIQNKVIKGQVVTAEGSIRLQLHRGIRFKSLPYSLMRKVS